MIDKKLLQLLGENKKYIFIVVALLLFGLIANTGITACICYALFLTVNKAELSEYTLPLVIAFAAVILRYFLTRLSGDMRDRLGRNVKKNLRNRLYDKLIRLGVNTGENISMAGLTRVSMEGVEQLDLYYSSYLPQFFYAMLAPVVLFIITVGIEWRVSVVLIGCVPLIPMSIMAVSKYAKRIFAKYWDKYTSMGDKFLDSVQGLRELKIFKADEICHEKMNESAEEFRKITMKVLVMQLASTTIMDLVAYSGAALGIAMAVLSVLNHGLSPISALFLVLVSVEFFLPLRAFGSAFHIAMNGASAGKKILELLEAEEPKWGSEDVENCDIHFENVTFSYDGERDVLKKVCLDIPLSGMTAIAGESGCGKSTMVNIILGACHPKSGSIKIGEKELTNLGRENYYKNIACVSYNTYLFHMTVRENFRLAKENVTDAEIYRALEKVNLAEFIRYNGGLDKVITENAENISGGQKQRLTLAIAMVSDKNIYIFDEATSNIDIESESIIFGNIMELSKTKSVIVISHRLENIIKADNICFMSNGEIKEMGTHESLMAENGGYAKLYMTQKNLEKGYLEV